MPQAGLVLRKSARRCHRKTKRRNWHLRPWKRRKKRRRGSWPTALAKDPNFVDALVLLTCLGARSSKDILDGLQKAVSAGGSGNSLHRDSKSTRAEVGTEAYRHQSWISSLESGPSQSALQRAIICGTQEPLTPVVRGRFRRLKVCSPKNRFPSRFISGQ
jgi:hypothetical protein